MPQASDKDRQRMIDWFGSIDAHGPEKLLRSHGFELKRWYWVKPTPAYELSEIDRHCIWFLHDEWDYGGVIG